MRRWVLFYLSLSLSLIWTGSWHRLTRREFIFHDVIPEAKEKNVSLEWQEIILAGGGREEGGKWPVLPSSRSVCTRLLRASVAISDPVLVFALFVYNLYDVVRHTFRVTEGRYE